MKRFGAMCKLCVSKGQARSSHKHINYISSQMLHAGTGLLVTLILAFGSNSAHAALLKVEFHGARAESGPGFCVDFIYECPEYVDLSFIVDTMTYESLGYTINGDTSRVNSYAFSGASITEISLSLDGQVLWDDASGLTLRGGGDNPSLNDNGCFCILASNEVGGRSFEDTYSTAGFWPLSSELGDDPLDLLLLAMGPNNNGLYGFTGEWGRLQQVSGITTLAAVPIPPAIWLFVTGLLSLLLGVSRCKVVV